MMLNLAVVQHPDSLGLSDMVGLLERRSSRKQRALLEGQADSDADGPSPVFGVGRRRPFVGCLHQSRSAPLDDVTTHFGQRGGQALRLVVHPRARRRTGRAEDRDPVALMRGGAEASEGVDGLPEPEERLAQERLDVLLIREADDVLCRGQWPFIGHVWLP